MSRVPRIRFKGFKEDWEQRKLGEVFEEYSEKNRSELPPLTIIQGGGTIRRDESDRALQYDKGSLSNYKVVNKGDFIVHLRSFEGGLEKANSTGIVSPAYHTLSGENTDTTFYYAYFRSRKFIESDLKPHVYGIRDGRSIDIEGMKTINIPYTIFDEQRRIGKFIDLIDHLITLHQRKFEKLKIIKKSMLENLFPQNGEKTPKIRFSGFTEDWEQRKLISCLSLLKDGTHGTHKDYPSGPLLLSAKNIKNGRVYYDETDRRISYKDFEKIHRNFKLQIGDILLTIVGSIGETALLNDSFEITFQRSVAFLRAKDNILPEFLRSEFNTGRFRNELEDRKSTSAQPGIYLGDLGEIPVFVSKNPTEQRRVGSYFESLDHLITLHQSKLDKLQKIKKSMLESMFV